MTPLTLIAPLLALTQAGDETGRNLVPESTEHPVVTFTADDARASLHRVDMSPSEHARLTYGKGGGLWIMLADSERICVAPCGRQLSNADLYAVSGPGVTRSKFFVLPRASNVKVTARAGSSTVYTLGAVMAVVGALGLIPSVAAIVDPSARPYGLAGLGGSLGLLGGGAFVAYEGSTFVDVTKVEGGAR